MDNTKFTHSWLKLTHTLLFTECVTTCIQMLKNRSFHSSRIECCVLMCHVCERVVYYKVHVFSDVTFCSLVASKEQFEANVCFHFHGINGGIWFLRNVGYCLPLDIGLILFLCQYCLRFYQDW
jgi:hypothetical protein